MFDYLKSILKGSIIYGLGHALNSIAQLALLPVFTSYLSSEQFGKISTLIVFSSVFSSLFSLGVGTSLGVLYFRSTKILHRDKTIWSSVVVLLLTGLFSILIVSFFSSQFISVFLSDLIEKKNFALALFSALLMMIEMPLLYRLQFDNKAVYFFSITTVYLVLSILFKLLFIICFDLGVEGFFIGEVLSRAISIIILLTIFFKLGPFLDFKYMIELLRLGLPLLPSLLCVYILQQGAFLCIQRYYGMSMAGIYSVGNNLGLGMLLFISAVTTAWFPFFMSFKFKLEEAYEVFHKVFKYYLLIGGGIVICFFMFSETVVSQFFSKEYYSSHHIIGIISLGYFISGMSNFFYPIFYFNEQVYKITLYQLVSTVLFMPICFFLVQEFTIYGGSFSLIIGNGMVTISIVLHHLYAKNRIDIYKSYSFKLVIFIFFLCVLGLLLNYFINNEHIVIWACIFAFYFLFVTIFFLTKGEKNTFLNLLKNKKM